MLAHDFNHLSPKDNKYRSRESIEAAMLLESDEEERKSQTAMLHFSAEDSSDGYATPTEVGFSPKRRTPNVETVSSDSEFNSVAQTSPCGSKSNLSGWESDLSVKLSMSALENKCTDVEKLKEENAKLRVQVEVLLKNSAETVIELFNENKTLKEQLVEANNYVDHVDVENEQQYSSMSRHIDELCHLMNLKNKEIFKLKKELEDSQHQLEAALSSVEKLKASNGRQTEIIESLRDDLDREKEFRSGIDNEKERLYCELSDLQRKIENDRSEFLAKELLMSIDLEDVQRALDKQKEILSSTTVSSLVDKWERRVLDLENALRERDVMLHTQQQIINEMRRRGTFMDRSATSSGESLDSAERSAIEFRRKKALLRYLTSDESDRCEMLGTVAVALDLTKDEEDYLRNSLMRQKKNRRKHFL